jgi:aspartate racemase
MAAFYLQEIRSIHEGPVLLGGFSFGGIIAFEMAQQLQAQGVRVSLLAIIDIEPPALYRQVAWRPRWLIHFARNLPGWLYHDVLRASPSELLARIRRKLGLIKNKTKSLFGLTDKAASPWRADVEALADVSRLPEEYQRLWEANYQAVMDYGPQVYPGRVTVIRSRVQPLFCSHEPDMGWRKLAAGGLDIIGMPGNHETIVIEPRVQLLSERLQALLVQAQGYAQDGCKQSFIARREGDDQPRRL